MTRPPVPSRRTAEQKWKSLRRDLLEKIEDATKRRDTSGAGSELAYARGALGALFAVRDRMDRLSRARPRTRRR